MNIPKQRGGVLAEFIVISGFVLMPLALLLPMVFKHIENRQMTEQAARYAVWERVAYFQSKPKNRNSDTPVKSDVQISNEIRNRVFADKNTAIYLDQNTNKVQETLNPVLQVKDLTSNKWVTLFEEDKNKAGFYHNSQSRESELPGDFSKISTAIGNVLSFAPGLELSNKGFYQVTVSSKLRSFKWFPELGDNSLAMTRQGALLTEGWMIGGPEAAKKELKYLVPISAFAEKLGLEKLMKILSILPIAEELDWLDLAKIEPDAVPCVRLGTYDNKGRVSTPSICERRLKTKLQELGHRRR
ncbi:hypothetical protein L9G74_17225 [Shewanella sp. C32]|uniref:Uncharacterized protein n=1 Tax=Shewanella electrica TaxID=515560 RepID=A0ABT2FPE0_9GAMM|nr:hypothetical protein [Shewanella electrica]MCH1926562.1 hypothetical protein [Shewanella electrica]MCS4558183.1 hypothetical protein [Shewanella electrica]